MSDSRIAQLDRKCAKADLALSRKVRRNCLALHGAVEGLGTIRSQGRHDVGNAQTAPPNMIDHRMIGNGAGICAQDRGSRRRRSVISMVRRTPGEANAKSSS